MKVLFAIGNAQTSKSVADKYFQINGEKLDYKDVFYFRALLEEVKKDKSYDRIIISEELEPIKAVTIEEIDQKIFSNIDNITDELQNAEIAFIGSDRRTKTDPLISRLFNIGVYSLLLENDRNITSLCNVIKEPKSKKEAKEYLNLNPAMDSSASSVRATNDEEVPEPQMAHILKHYESLGEDTSQYISSFETIEEQFSREQLVIIAAAICKYLPSIVPETISKDPRYSSIFMPFLTRKTLKTVNTNVNAQKHVAKKSGILNFLTGKKERASEQIISESAKIQEEEEKKARIAAEKAEAESKRMREEAEKASRLQMEQLKQEREAAQRAKEEAKKFEKEQEELRKKAIAEQKAKEQVAKNEQEQLRKQAIAEQKAREQAVKQIKKENDEIEIDLSALQKETQIQKVSSTVQQANSQEELKQRAIAEQKAREQAAKQIKKENDEIEIDLSALQKETQIQKVSSAVQQTNSQEELKQRAIAEQKAKEQSAKQQAKEQEELRQRALAEQKAKEQAAKQQVKEQEELRQRALAEQKAKEQAEEQAREQEKFRLELQSNQVADEALNQESDVTNVKTPTSSSAILATDVGDGEIESNFVTAMYQLPSDYKKVVAFVGTNKVGTTFVANAVANNTSAKGIKTSLLDMTKSRGLYYLYNKSDQRKIQIASECIKDLSEGTNNPITVDKNKNLLVYTSLPSLGENRKNYKHKTIIDTIKRNCNLLIIDCDFTTPLEYFEQASEIYLVQDMDVIKLQETTAFLREFKNRNIDWDKLSVVINKYVKSSFTPKKIVEVGLAYYNDPQMTYTEEFETIKSYTTVPFTIEDYVRYTEDVVKDKIVYKNYSVQLRDAIEQICRKIYPVGNENRKKGMFR